MREGHTDTSRAAASATALPRASNSTDAGPLHSAGRRHAVKRALKRAVRAAAACADRARRPCRRPRHAGLQRESLTRTRRRTVVSRLMPEPKPASGEKAPGCRGAGQRARLRRELPVRPSRRHAGPAIAASTSSCSTKASPWRPPTGWKCSRSPQKPGKRHLLAPAGVRRPHSAVGYVVRGASQGPNKAAGTTPIPSARRYAVSPVVTTIASRSSSPISLASHLRWRTCLSSTVRASLTSIGQDPSVQGLDDEVDLAVAAAEGPQVPSWWPRRSGRRPERGGGTSATRRAPRGGCRREEPEGPARRSLEQRVTRRAPSRRAASAGSARWCLDAGRERRERWRRVGCQAGPDPGTRGAPRTAR